MKLIIHVLVILILVLFNNFFMHIHVYCSLVELILLVRIIPTTAAHDNSNDQICFETGEFSDSINHPARAPVGACVPVVFVHPFANERW